MIDAVAGSVMCVLIASVSWVLGFANGTRRTIKLAEDERAARQCRELGNAVESIRDAAGMLDEAINEFDTARDKLRDERLAAGDVKPEDKS